MKKTIRRQNNYPSQSQNKQRLQEYIESEKDYYKPVSVRNFWNNNFIKYESSGDKDKTLSIKTYFDETKPYLKDIRNSLQKSETQQLMLFLIKALVKNVSCIQRVITQKS